MPRTSRLLFVQRWGGRALILLLVVSIGLAASITVLTNSTWGRERVRRALLSALDGAITGQVRIGSISGNLLRGLTLHDVTITDGTEPPFLRAQRIQIGYALRALLQQRVSLYDVVLDHTAIALQRDENGEWNYERLLPQDTSNVRDTLPGWGDWITLREVRLVASSVLVLTPTDTQRFEQIHGHLPLLQLADPTDPTMRFEVQTLALRARLLHPPGVEVRNVRGILRIDQDSLWFTDVALSLPASHATLAGRYRFMDGALDLETPDASLAFTDWHFLYPPLPAHGGAHAGITISIRDSTQRYAVRNLEAYVDQARIRGYFTVDAGREVRIDDAVLDVTDLPTSLIEQVAPDLQLPLRGVLNGRARVRGPLNDTHAEGDVAFLDLAAGSRGARSHISGVVRWQSAPSDLRQLDADLSLSPLSLASVGRFVPALQLRGAAAGRVNLHGPLRALRAQARLTGAGGTVVARGLLDLHSPVLGYALEVRVDSLHPQRWSARAPTSTVTAVMAAQARGTTIETLAGTFRADAVASSLTTASDTVRLDSLRLRLRVDRGLLQVDTVAVQGHAARADLPEAARQRLTISAAGDIGLTAKRDGVLRWHAALDTGTVTATGQLQGNRFALNVDGRVTARNATIEGQQIGRGLIVVRGRQMLTDTARWDVAVQGDSLRSGDRFFMEQMNGTATYQRGAGTLQLAVRQASDRQYAAEARYHIHQDERELQLDQLRLRFDSTQWQSVRPGRIRWGARGVFVDSLEVRHGNNGRVFVHGLLPTGGETDLEVIVRQFRIGDLLALLQDERDADGWIDLEARVSGPRRAPIGHASLRVTGGSYRGTDVPLTQVSAEYADRLLAFQGSMWDSIVPPRDTAPRMTAVTGQRLLQGQLRLPIDLSLVTVPGSRLLEAPASGSVVADSLPLALLGRFSDAVEHVGGFARGELAVGGTWKSPIPSGRMTVEQGAAYLSPFGIMLRDIAGAVSLQRDTVRVDSLVAWSRGPLRVSGGIVLPRWSRPVMALTLRGERTELLNNEQGRVRADVDVAVTGPLDSIRVAGETRIREGVFYLPEPDDREVINAGDPGIFNVIDTTDVRTQELLAGESPMLRNLRLDMRLRVDRDTWVRSPDANIEIYSDGDLRVVIDRRRQTLTLDGIVQTDRGDYEFLGKRFRIRQGSVRFVGVGELNPSLQITGAYEVKQPGRPALAIRILIGGTMRSPRLTLESDAQPPISQSDLLSYLAFGSETGSLLQLGGSGLAGGNPGGSLVGTSAALATRQLTGIALGVAVDELEGQAARSLGADVLTITPANVPTELASGQFGALGTFLKGTQLEFGKYLQPRTFVGLQLQATTTPGFRLEHRLGRNPGLTLESTLQPRLFLPEPSLSQQQITKVNALGVFLVRRWRF